MRWIALVGFVTLNFLAAAVGGWLSAGAVGGWYRTILKPEWSPPDWVFGPVWTTLYVMIGVAGWHVWQREPSSQRTRALWLYAMQWVCNAAWTPLFFGIHRMDLAAFDILLLWLLIGGFAWVARRVSVPASVLFLPYLGWVTFAAVLNATLWHMNS